MPTGFMNVTHCARMAVRQALPTGEVVHVVSTGNELMPMMVIDEHQLLTAAIGMVPKTSSLPPTRSPTPQPVDGCPELVGNPTWRPNKAPSRGRT